MDIEQDQQAIAPDTQAIESQPGAVADSNNADPTGAPAKVEETEQEKAERIVQERKVREDRARRKINARFSELTAEAREKDALIRELIQQRSPAQPQQRTDGDPEPDQEKFADYGEFLRAQARWVARQEAKSTIKAQRDAWEVEQQQRRASEAAAQLGHSHLQRVSAYAKTNPEFATVLESDVEIGGHAPALIAMMDDGPAVMLAIAKNPELADRLNSAAPVMQGVILGQISAALKSRVPQVSKAPAPGKPVSGQSSGGGKDLATAEIDDYIKQRRAARSR